MIINKSLFLFSSQVNVKARMGDENMLNMTFFIHIVRSVDLKELR